MTLIETLVELLHEEGPDKLTLERRNQYAAIFKDDPKLIQSLEGKEWTVGTSRQYFESLRDRLLEKNQGLAAVVGIPPVLQVNNLREITSAKRSADEHAVVIDSFVTTLLWTMDKAWAYGRNIAREEQDVLFCNLFVHFATLRSFLQQGLVWPRPKTPPHQTKEGLALLTFMVGAQESFLIGHELGHIYVDRGGELPKDPVCMRDFATSYTFLKPRDASIDQELLADELAFEFTLRAYQENESLEVVAVTSIFLLIRYHLWLAVICSNGEDDRDFTLWFGRNSLFREKARHICRGETLRSIVEVSELMEEAIEPAAFRAEKAFKLIREKADK